MKKGMSGKMQRQEMIKKLQGVKVCPATSGLPETMTLESFRKVCERCQQQERSSYKSERAYKYTLCDVCQGNFLPKELIVESLAVLEAKRRRSGNAGTFPDRKKGASTKSQPRRQPTC